MKSSKLMFGVIISFTLICCGPASDADFENAAMKKE